MRAHKHAHTHRGEKVCTSLITCRELLRGDDSQVPSVTAHVVSYHAQSNAPGCTGHTHHTHTRTQAVQLGGCKSLRRPVPALARRKVRHCSGVRLRLYRHGLSLFITLLCSSLKDSVARSANISASLPIPHPNLSIRFAKLDTPPPLPYPGLSGSSGRDGHTFGLSVV